MIAFAAEGRLELVDLADCRITTVANGAAGDVRFSADHRWLAFSRTVAYRPSGPVVVSVDGGAARSPLGRGVLAWSWAPKAALLYGINGRGQLLAWRPAAGVRVLATGVETANASSPAVVPSPDGRELAIDRSVCTGAPEELYTITLRGGARRIALQSADGQATFAGWSPDGRWLLYWQNGLCSASIAADGLALKAAPASGAARPRTAIRHMLLYRDYLSWCGRRLIAAATPSRETQLGSALVVTGPPGWHQRTIQPGSRLSWVSPACSPSGKLLAAAAGPNTEDSEFGIEHRSIWLLARDGKVVRQLTTPPASKLSDEAPRFSRDGRWILFVRTGERSNGSRDTIELVPVDGAGAAVAIVEFESGDFSYYDHFDWPTEIAWSAAADAAP